MADCEAIADLDLLAIFAAYAKESADNALLIGVSPEGVVEDSEYSLDNNMMSTARKLFESCSCADPPVVER